MSSARPAPKKDSTREIEIVLTEPLAAAVESAPVSPAAKRGCCGRCRGWLSFAAVFLILICLIAFLIPSFLFQGISMLGLYLAMPSVMRHVYPSRLGMLHVFFFRMMRHLTVPAAGHSRSIRVDLRSYSAAAAKERGAACEAGTGGGDLQDPSAVGEAGGTRVGGGSTLRYSVHTVACLLDNYAYVIVDRSTPPPRPVALVDPCEPKAVLSALKAISEEDYEGEALQPVAILTTHKHWDHAGGNVALKRTFPGIAVFGSEADSVAGCTHALRDGDMLTVGGLVVQAIGTPGHTRGSLTYVLRGPSCSVCFGGDLLFCGGCGAPFEGSADQMCHSFAKLWRTCADEHGEALLFPGHEYTLSILPQYFSGAMPMPDGGHAYAKLCSMVWRARELRSQSTPVPTVPLRLSDEVGVNCNFAPLRRAADALVSAWRLHKLTSAPLESLQPLLASDSPTRHLDTNFGADIRALGADGPERGTSAGKQPAPAQDSRCFECSDAGGGAGVPGPDGAGGASATQQADACGSSSSGDGGVGTSSRRRSRTGARPGRKGEAVPLTTVSQMAVVAFESLLELERLLPANADGAARLVQKILGGSTQPPSDAPPPCAIAHADLAEDLSPTHRLVTTADTEQAFELLGCSPGTMHARTLLRALTGRGLADSPLSADQANELAAKVGTDAHGLVSLGAFNSALGVLPPVPEAPPPPGCCRRCVVRFSRGLGRLRRTRRLAAAQSAQERRYELPDATADPSVQVSSF